MGQKVPGLLLEFQKRSLPGKNTTSKFSTPLKSGGFNFIPESSF